MVFRMKGANDMKLYNVFVYNYVGSFADVWEIVDVIDVKGVPQA